MPPLLADFTHARPCKPFCEKYLTLPGDVFGIEHMSMECVMLFVLFAIVTEPTLRYGTILVEKIGGIITNRTK